MLDDFFYPNDNVKVWSGNFILLAFSGFLTFAMVYGLLTANTMNLTADEDYTFGQAAFYMSTFAIGPFLIGSFNAFLIDRYKRKSVCQLALLLLIVTTFLLLYVTTPSGIMILRLAQGIFFSLVIMAGGNTLAIDVTPSHKRTHANVSYAWSIRFGSLLGLMFSAFFYGTIRYEHLIYILCGLGLLGLILMLPVKVKFHAPLNPPIFSLDRFLLLSTLRLAANLLLIGMILGFLIGHNFDYTFFLLIAVGFVLAIIFNRLKLNDISIITGTETGYAVLILGLVLSALSTGIVSYYIGSVITGIGMGITLSRYLLAFIGKAQHCERGTAGNTYMITMELGVLLGFLCENIWSSSASNLDYIVSLVICIFSVILFEINNIKSRNSK